jgi:hypothetical protein
MITKLFPVMLLALTGLLLAASPARAANRPGEYEEDDYWYEREERYDRNAKRGAGDISYAAEQLEYEAERLHHLAYIFAHRESRKEAKAVGRLYSLAEQAEYFRAVAERKPAPSELRSKFEYVLSSWTRAKSAYRELNPTPEVDRQFRRATAAMRELQALMGKKP